MKKMEEEVPAGLPATVSVIWADRYYALGSPALNLIISRGDQLPCPARDRGQVQSGGSGGDSWRRRENEISCDRGLRNILLQRSSKWTNKQ